MFRRAILSMVLLGNFILSGFSLSAQQTPPDVYSLQRVLEIGINNSYELKKARLDEEGANYQRKEIIGTGLPQLNAYGNYNNFLEVTPMGLPGGFINPNSSPNDIDVVAFGVPQSMQAGAQLTQLIFSQSYLVGLKAARTSEEFYDLLTRMSKEDIMYDLAMNYYGIVALELQRENIEANLAKIENLEKILKVQHENDLAKKVDYSRIKVNLVKLEVSRDDLETGIEQRKNYLKLLMGIPISTPFEIEEMSFDEQEEGLTAAQLDQEIDLQQRADIQVLNKQDELYDLNIKNIRSGYYPSLVGFADVNYNTFSNDFSFLSESKRWYRGSLIGLKLEVPIFDGFQRKNKVAQAKITREQLKQDRDMATQAAEMDYRNAVQKLNNSIRSARAQEENLALAEDVYQQTELLYKEGLSPLTDLLDAETALREARSAYYNQIVNVKTAEIELYKSTGNIAVLMQ